MTNRNFMSFFIVFFILSIHSQGLDRWTDISYDGNSLETAKSFTRVLKDPNSEIFSNCTHIQYLRETIFVGGPYWVDENIKCSILEPNPEDITLVTQFSIDRLDKFLRLAKIWNGPISATLVVNDNPKSIHTRPDHLNNTLAPIFSRAHWPFLFYTDLHILWGNEKGNYPVNIARNIALERSRTKRVFLIDIDFFPFQGIRHYINQGLMDEDLRRTDEKTLLVFPAFEHPDLRKFNRVYLPETKEEMFGMLKQGEFEVFHQRTCPGCHRPSNYSHWFLNETTESYEIEYKKLYEPYVIASKDHLVPFDERFADYGRNKVQFFYHLSTLGYEYRVLPFPCYVIHENHPPTQWAKEYKGDDDIKQVSKDLWVDFQNELKDLQTSLKNTTLETLISKETVNKNVMNQKLHELEERVNDEKKKNLEMEKWIKKIAQSFSNEEKLEMMQRILSKKYVYHRHIENLNHVDKLNHKESLKDHVDTIEENQEWIFTPIFAYIMFMFVSILSIFMCYRYNPMKNTLIRSFVIIPFIVVFIFATNSYYRTIPAIQMQQVHHKMAIQSVNEYSFDSLGSKSECKEHWIEAEPSRLVIWNEKNLIRFANDWSIDGSNEPSHPSYHAIVRMLPSIMREPIRTVLSKKLIAPSNDKNDFFSRTFYVPGKDGKMHVDVFSNKYDKSSLWDMEANCMHLSIAYYFTGKSIYAKKVSEMVRAWFIDPHSRMNPHFLYASYDPNQSTPFGRRYGLVESHPIKNILESIGIIHDSGYWDEDDSRVMTEWVQNMTLWMMESNFGKGEEQSGNNHQTGYYASLLHFLIYQGREDIAKTLLSEAMYKLIMQFSPEGEQHKELSRPDAWWYVGYNLHFMTDIAIMGSRLGVDMWNLEYKSRSIKKAIDWVVPYLIKEKNFSHGDHELTKVDLLLTYMPVLRKASIGLKDLMYEDIKDQIVEMYGIKKEDDESFYQMIYPKR